MDLARLVVAIAWADGRIEHEEVNALKDLLFNLPEVTGGQWQELEIYLDSPVDEAEREGLLARVLEGARGPEDRALALEVLERVAACDGRVSAEEEAALREVRRAFEDRGAGLAGRLGRWLRPLIKRRRERARQGLGRERRMEDWIRNTVYYQLVSELEAGKIDLPEERVRMLCLAAGLMARVAWVDEEIAPEEKETIQRALREDWNLSGAEARLVTEIAVSRAVKGLDLARLTRSFYECTGYEERKSFAGTLFRVANAAGRTSPEEVQEIRKIAGALKLSHKDWIRAKLTVPREDRPEANPT